MKLSEQWLREWVDPNLSTHELANQLTMAGLEVDTVLPAAPEFRKVVVGEIIDCKKHPDASRLRVCQVDVGAEQSLSIVCGGVNVSTGLKVPVSMVGALLPGGIKIKKTKLRGEISEGMICAAKELGIEKGDETAGEIMELPTNAPVGMDFRDYYQLNDHIFDIELTPNRGDCLSIQGIARDVAVITKTKWHPPQIEPVPATIDTVFPVNLQAKDACPRYIGRVINHIDHQATIPVWLEERLRRSGIRSVHPVVDICNYVMLELGQPMHAFDLEKLSGEIQIRYAKANEKITLLDGNQMELQENTLLIADQKQPQAIAGIMGAFDSAVSQKTTSIFLESAYFDPVHLRLDAKQYRLQTDSSYRFERGVDFNLQQRAIERASTLILELLGGNAGPLIEVTSSTHLPKQSLVYLRKKSVKRILGISFSDKQIVTLLQALGMSCQSRNEGWEVTIPSFRFDITQEIDLIEELARIYGYDNIPTERVRSQITMPTIRETKLHKSQITDLLVNRDYHEVVTYSFVDEKLQNLLEKDYQPIRLQNPIASDMNVMRSSIWPGLLQAYMHNLNRHIERVRLFEMGLCFIQKEDSLEQVQKLGLLIAGEVFPEQWGVKARRVDFFDLKGDVMALLQMTNEPSRFTWAPGTHSALHPGQSVDLYQKDQIVGHLGALHPKIAQHLNLNEIPYIFEINVKAIEDCKLPAFQKITKFPAIRRDIAVVVDEKLSTARLITEIYKQAGKLLHKAQVFDIYKGKGVEGNKKSVALGLIFQDSTRTLTDEEINAIIHDVVAKLQREFNAQLRT